MTEEEIQDKYQKLEPTYLRLAKAVQEALKHKLNSKGIKTVSVIYRTKTIESFLEKIERKQYNKPFTQNTDFAGVRVICLYTSDIYKIQEIIKKEFIIKKEENKTELLSFDKMGYQGFSFVIELNNNYSGTHYEGLHNLKCEIQLRTATQDNWAMINHDLLYKREELIPIPLKRAINNVSSLLEIAQSIFDDIQNKRIQYTAEIKTKSEDFDELLNQPINDTTLRTYTEKKFKDIAIKVKENIHNLILRDIDIVKYPSLKSLDEAINNAKPPVDAYYKESPELFKAGSDYITKSLGFIDGDFLKKHPFGQKTKEAIQKYRTLIK